MKGHYYHSYLLGILLCLGSCTGETQSSTNYVPLQGIATLPKALKETSGLARANGASYYTHNDSGNRARLYQISALSGKIEHEFTFKSVKNNDWEDLAEDNDYLYIGDTGNNEGKRKNLMIHKIRKGNLPNGDSLHVETIRFTYPGMKASSGKHNFDCEAFVAIGDSLYLFSKNRGDLGTDVYRLPKVAGEYEAQKLVHFHTNGLITSAAFHAGDSNTLVLLGYEIIGSRYKSFFWLFSGFQGTNFFSGKHQRYEISPNLQAEAVLFDSDTSVVITNEEELAGLGKMNRIIISSYLK